MRHAVLGMGGVGGLIAATLARAGDEVAAVVRDPGSYPTTIALDAPPGRIEAPVRPVAFVDEKYDLVWVAVKATQLEEALGRVRVVEQLVPLLNGIDHIRLLRRRFGADGVVPATISVEAERLAPGRFVRRSQIALLGVTTEGAARLGRAPDALRAGGMTVHAFDDETTLLWTKLVFLAPLALSTTAAAASLGDVRDEPALRALLLACVDEACAAAIGAGARIDTEATKQRLLNVPGAFRSSMQKDVAAGRPPELDAIAGPILAAGDAPATRELVARVRARTPA